MGIVKRNRTAETRLVAISTELDWGLNRSLEVYAGCQRYADEAGWQCVINPASDRAFGPGASSRPFDGILARASRHLAQAARQAGVPVVNVWMNSPARDELPGVFPDFEAAGAMAARHLMGRGFRQFGYLGFPRDIDSTLQLKGFQDAIRAEGFACTVHRFPHSHVERRAAGWTSFVAGLDAWIETWKLPIGIFVSQDICCRYLIDVCRSKGLHISQDVAIVGCHNETKICDSPPPSITSIDLGYARIGHEAAALLDHLMDGHPPPAAPVLVAPAELIPRRTTDSYAVDDPLVARALRFIAEKGNKRMRVQNVVTAMATTRRTLERRFREAMGSSIAAEIARLRIERAKRRLVETDASLKTVARDSGFRNADHFYKVFARSEGLPPSTYRETRQRVFMKRDG